MCCVVLELRHTKTYHELLHQACVWKSQDEPGPGDHVTGTRTNSHIRQLQEHHHGRTTQGKISTTVPAISARSKKDTPRDLPPQLTTLPRTLPCRLHGNRSPRQGTSGFLTHQTQSRTSSAYGHGTLLHLLPVRAADRRRQNTGHGTLAPPAAGRHLSRLRQVPQCAQLTCHGLYRQHVDVY